MKVQDMLDAFSTSEIVLELVVLVLVEEPGKPGSARQSIFKRRICHVISPRLSEKASEAIPTISKRMVRWFEDGTTLHIGRK